MLSKHRGFVLVLVSNDTEFFLGSSAHWWTVDLVMMKVLLSSVVDRLGPRIFVSRALVMRGCPSDKEASGATLDVNGSNEHQWLQ